MTFLMECVKIFSMAATGFAVFFLAVLALAVIGAVIAHRVALRRIRRSLIQ